MLTADRVLRALSRFDAARVSELAECFGGQSRRGAVFMRLTELVDRGLVERMGEGKRNVRYRVTAAGRAAIKVAA